MYLQRMLRSYNATSHPNYNKEALSKNLASPRATLKQTTVEKKPNSVEKTARSAKETPADLEPTSFQMQQLRAHGSQALTRMDNSNSSSWSDSFKEKANSVKNGTGTATPHEMEKQL
ncbi:1501_t:CDS:1 [Acaulospora colombiana]|uniref:1501_t:CDS:1 n=1 Tax=Acaulospora colombiana TaxID=27376 RepID=A0ACA9KX68_9GLOM|nr:1501_t:CDS:1 [Acaulospora colombiana]